MPASVAKIAECEIACGAYDKFFLFWVADDGGLAGWAGAVGNVFAGFQRLFLEKFVIAGLKVCPYDLL